MYIVALIHHPLLFLVAILFNFCGKFLEEKNIHSYLYYLSTFFVFFVGNSNTYQIVHINFALILISFSPIVQSLRIYGHIP